MHPEPYEDSRRLTGCNVYFAATGAALETARGWEPDEAALDRWRASIATAREVLGWPQGEIVVNRHRTGASLAFAAPMDQLYTATEVNEWAWWSALWEPLEPDADAVARDDAGALAVPFSLREKVPRGGREQEQEPEFYHAPGHAAVWDADSAIQTLRLVAKAESRPELIALQLQADAHGLPLLADDDEVTIGEGTGCRTWFAEGLPSPVVVPWAQLHKIPTALVTGSNGKTTTVRLLAAMATAHGWRTAYSCTDGVFFDGKALEAGDFSGPTGTRTALRQDGAEAAILETARGGMLRRGLALCHANVAIVTNIAADHFGEYGVHDLDDLARVKLTVGRAIRQEGRLVLNADDPTLVKHAQALTAPLAWFALDFDHPLLRQHREQGGATCGVRDGRLLLYVDSVSNDLGAVTSMPLTVQGRAPYNIANLAGAALTASALGVPPVTIAGIAAHFGSGRDDNPGRLQRWCFGDVQVYVDYAHNPDGLRGLLEVALSGRGAAQRFALLLGQAGNREDDDIRELVATAMKFRPSHVVLKDIGEGYMRGRAPGEIAALMHGALVALGMPESAIVTCLDEAEAARRAVAWARKDDVVVLPLHEPTARVQAVTLLDRMEAEGWRPGMAVPPLPALEA
jgi:UDP-N-acetylmuramyl tripeptide synthase